MIVFAPCEFTNCSNRQNFSIFQPNTNSQKDKPDKVKKKGLALIDFYASQTLLDNTKDKSDHPLSQAINAETDGSSSPDLFPDSESEDLSNFNMSAGPALLKKSKLSITQVIKQLPSSTIHTYL